MADNKRETQSGKGWFGSKDLAYLKKVSRQAVEDHTNTSMLYFEIDYENSKRNFYGEMLVKAFKVPQGVEVKGIIKAEQSDGLTLERVPNKLPELGKSP